MLRKRSLTMKMAATLLASASILIVANTCWLFIGEPELPKKYQK